MSIGGGFSSQKSKSTEDTTSNYNRTSTLPDWAQASVQGLGDMLKGVAGQDPASFLAGASPLQLQQFGLAGDMGGKAGGYFDAAGGAAGGLAGFAPQQVTGARVATPSYVKGATASDGVGRYMDPFEDQVVQRTQQDIERQRQMAGIDTNAAATAAHAFGGSRHGVADAETNEAYGRLAADKVAGLRSQGYSQALQFADADANRAQGADTFNAGANNTRGLTEAGFDQQGRLANQGADIAGAGVRSGAADLLSRLGLSGFDALGAAGSTQQGLNQAGAQAPLNLIDFLNQQWGGIGGLVGGETGTETSSSKGTGKTSGFSIAAKYGK